MLFNTDISVRTHQDRCKLEKPPKLSSESNNKMHNGQQTAYKPSEKY